MKVTLLPAQIVVWLAEIVTEGVKFAVTLTVMAFAVADGAVRQTRLLVITQVTTSLFAKELVVYWAFTAPIMFAPFTFH